LFRHETTRLLAERRRMTTPDMAALKDRLARVEQQIANMLAAIKDGFRSDSLKRDLEQAERERLRLREQFDGDVRALEKVATIPATLLERFKSLVDNLPTVLQREVDKARHILRDLLGGRIALHPTSDGAQRYLTAELSGSYAALVQLMTGKNKFGCGGRI